MISKLTRAFCCLLAWCFPLIGNRLALMLAPPPGGAPGVNMFGLTDAQNTWAFAGIGIGLIGAIAVIVIGRLGWLWVAVAAAIAVAGALLGALINNAGWGFGRTFAVVLLVLAPLAAGLLTPAPRPAG